MRFGESEKGDAGCGVEVFPSHDQAGAALMLVLWVMVLLTAMAAEFVLSMRTDVNITRNFKDETRAYYGALAGIEEAKAEIMSFDGPVYTDEEGLLALGEEAPQREGALGTVRYSYTITDEERKINLNSATPRQLRIILREGGVEEERIDTIVDSVLDWRDGDSLHRLNGAEEDYYRSLPRPYSCKDAPFETVEELLMVRGVSPEILFGSGDGGRYRGIAPYLTARSSGRININTAGRVVLEARFGPAEAARILLRRSSGPLAVAPATGGTTRSAYFTVLSTGRAGEIRRTIKALMKKKGSAVEVLYWDDNWQDRTSSAVQADQATMSPLPSKENEGDA